MASLNTEMLNAAHKKIYDDGLHEGMRQMAEGAKGLRNAACRVNNLAVEEANFKGDEAEWQLILIAKQEAQLNLMNEIATFDYAAAQMTLDAGKEPSDEHAQGEV